MSNEITWEEFCDYEIICDDLAKLKDQEMKMRKDFEERIKKTCKKDGKKFVYSGKSEEGDLFSIEITEKFNLNLDQRFVEEYYEEMAEEEQDCLKQKWVLSDAKFNKLDKDEGYMIFDAVTQKPGAPGIKLIKK